MVKLKKAAYFFLIIIIAFCINIQSVSTCKAQKTYTQSLEETTQTSSKSDIDEIGNKPITEVMKRNKKEKAKMPSPMEVFANLITLIIIMFALAWLYNKFGKKAIQKALSERASHKNDIKIISTAPMGQNKFLHIIEVDGERVLIGSTNNTISLLKELKTEKAVSDGQNFENRQ